MRQNVESAVSVRLVNKLFLIFFLPFWLSYSDTPDYSKTQITFGKYEALFKSLCTGVDKDGRGDDLRGMIAEGIELTKTCTPCKALFKSMYSECKLVVKKTPKPKKGEESKHAVEGAEDGEPTATPTPVVLLKIRQPNIEVIDTASRFTSSLYEEGRSKEAAWLALKSLLDLLRRTEGKSLGAIDYFDILATYLSAPWDRWLEEKKDLALTPVPTPNIDELFE